MSLEKLLDEHYWPELDKYLAQYQEDIKGCPQGTLGKDLVSDFLYFIIEKNGPNFLPIPIKASGLDTSVVIQDLRSIIEEDSFKEIKIKLEINLAETFRVNIYHGMSTPLTPKRLRPIDAIAKEHVKNIHNIDDIIKMIISERYVGV